MNELHVVIVGSGMYVSGRGTKGFGTIFPALCEWRRQGFPLGSVFLAATSAESTRAAKQKFISLNRLLGVDVSLKLFPDEGERGDPESYLKALREIPKPACAIVVVPDMLHKEIAGACIKEGLHTLVVKPLTPTAKEAKELIDLQKTKEVYGAIEFHKRFDRANLKLKEVISQGKIGDPLYFLVEYSQRKSIPSRTFSSWVDKTNIFQYLGVHYVDIIYFVTNALPKKVQVVAQNGWLKTKGIDTYDAIHATIQWELPNTKEFVSFIHTNWIDPDCTTAMSDQRMKVIGTKGRYESDQKKRGIVIVTDDHGVEEPNLDFCTSYPTSSGFVAYQGYGIESIHTFLRDVSDLINGRTTLDELERKRPTFRQGLISTAVVEAVNKGINKQNTWVEIDLS